MRLRKPLERDDRETVELVRLDVLLVGRERDDFMWAVLGEVHPRDTREVAETEEDDVTHRGERRS
jgi:hypothetical protein